MTQILSISILSGICMTSTCNEETNLSLAADSFRTRWGAYQSFPDYFGQE